VGFLEVGYRNGLVSRHLDFNTSSDLEIAVPAVEGLESKLL
jgi:hypothetical protein